MTCEIRHTWNGDQWVDVPCQREAEFQVSIRCEGDGCTTTKPPGWIATCSMHVGEHLHQGTRCAETRVRPLALAEGETP